LAEKLVESGIGTVERLGSMTPEELEALPGLEAESVPEIQAAVNSYYSQFEEVQADQQVAEEEPVPAEGEVAAGAAAAHEPGEVVAAPGESTENTTVSEVESARIGEKG
jgi:N utilization substance protein A